MRCKLYVLAKVFSGDVAGDRRLSIFVEPYDTVVDCWLLVGCLFVVDVPYS